MGVDTDALRWFQQVADGVTVTEVSQAEKFSQPAVSRALARLEEEVGTPLLQRSGRTLRLTRAGAAFKHHVDRMMHRLDDGLAAVSQVLDPERGTVSLAYHLSLGTWLIPDLISSYRTEHPEVRFELNQVRDERLAEVLATGAVDLDLSTVRPSDPAVHWTRLTAEPLRLAVEGSHPAARRDRVRLADLADEPFVTLRPPALLQRLTLDLCASAGFTPRVVFEGDDLSSVTGFVAAGLGVAIVPALHAGPALRAAASSTVPVDPATGMRYLTITEPRATRQIGLAWSSERRLLPAADAFREHVIDRAQAGLLPPALGAD